ncbi:MAG TPA: protocatechuate 3,4-dioxygenase subunit alpha [Terriglobales bacterium]|nr:protocatechuate 3,4-dioxygenase subunit alpha [Terriglobales bacterium]
MKPDQNLPLTPSQTVGPYFHLGLSARHCASSANCIRLHCRVLDGDGVPVNDAMLELWQADANGYYSSSDVSFTGFSRMATDENGACTFEIVKPGLIAAPNGSRQAPHLNVSVFARGLLKRACTRIYFASDRANDDDPILALVPEERRDTLIAQPDPDKPGSWHFDVRLSGDRETVFFDI